MRGENALLGAADRRGARRWRWTSEELTLAFPSAPRSSKKKAEDDDHRAAVGEALRAVTGRALALRYELRDELAAERPSRSARARRSEWVARFMDEFDAEEVIDEAESAQGGEARRRRARRKGRDQQRERRLMPKQPRMPNMQQMIKQVQKMQQDMRAAQEELKDEVVEASAGGGMVTVKVTGDLVVQDDQDRSRGGRPRGRRDARRTWCWRRSTRRCAGPGAGGSEAGRRHRRARPGGLGGLGLPGL